MSYYTNKIKYKIILMFMIAVLLLVVLFSATVGIADIGMGEAFSIMISRIPGIGVLVGNVAEDKTQVMIVLDIRMPRILLAAIVGALLSIIGGCFQGLFKNPMADPYVLGISNGAGLGATIAIVLGMGEMLWHGLEIGMVSGMAFAGALATAGVVYMIASVGGRLPVVNLLLAGIVTGLFESSLITVMMVLRRDKIEGIIMWLMGSVNAASWQQVVFLGLAAVPGIIVLCLFARQLNALASGDDTARSLGVKPETVRKSMLVLCSLLTAVCVSVSGIIGFVGLVIPHATRLMTGPDHRVLLPLSAVGGAIFLVLCDTIARSILPPVELPVGAITALFGAPYFAFLLIRAKRKVV